MRYSYEYKLKCVEMYRNGRYPETPEGVSPSSFRSKVRIWNRTEKTFGPEALRQSSFYKRWTSEEKLELVSRVLEGESCLAVAIKSGISECNLRYWVRKYQNLGYNGLVKSNKDKITKEVTMKKAKCPNSKKLEETEYEELVRLRAENAYIKAEIEVIKKEIALREERQAAQLKAKKQRSLRNSVNKDIN